jgi:L-2,4-diaminobutyrate decarboxylase
MSSTLFDPEFFRTAGHRLIDQLAEFLLAAQKGEMPVLPHPAPPELAGSYRQPLPLTPAADPVEAFSRHLGELIRQSNHLQHPGYIGHQVGAPVPIASLADAAAAVLNQSMAVYEMSPAATHIEHQVVRWLSDAIGWDQHADGVFTSGGSLGNLTALLAARNHATAGAAWTKGVRSGPPLAIIASEHAHYSVERAAGILGLGQDSVIRIPVDSQFRMQVPALADAFQAAQAQGKTVVAVVASAGTTATGSFDPLREIGEFCRAHHVWFHVDGAHGASVLLSPKYKGLAGGIGMADSAIWDTHKMLFMPNISTAVLFREGERSYRTFRQEASYLFGRHAYPEHDLGLRAIECTRPVQAWKLWLTLQVYGAAALGELVTQKLDLAREFAAALSAQPDFELLTAPMCNILCFRHLPAGAQGGAWSMEQMNAHQARVRRRVLASGRFYLVQTRIGGKLYLRCTLMNAQTTMEDLRGLMALIREVASQDGAGDTPA